MPCHTIGIRREKDGFPAEFIPENVLYHGGGRSSLTRVVSVAETPAVIIYGDLYIEVVIESSPVCQSLSLKAACIPPRREAHLIHPYPSLQHVLVSPFVGCIQASAFPEFHSLCADTDNPRDDPHWAVHDNQRDDVRYPGDGELAC